MVTSNDHRPANGVNTSDLGQTVGRMTDGRGD